MKKKLDWIKEWINKADNDHKLAWSTYIKERYTQSIRHWNTFKAPMAG